MTHDELANLTEAWLRSCKGRVTWTNMRMDIYGSGRPDVLSIAKTLRLSECAPYIHEIKVSRADFWSDVKSEKWKKYLPFCHGVFFVTPKGLIKKSEVPDLAGLLEYDGAAKYRYNSFEVVKRPRLNKGWNLPNDLIMRMILGRWGTEPSQFLKHAMPRAEEKA
jgi:hypothetical protein